LQSLPLNFFGKVGKIRTVKLFFRNHAGFGSRIRRVFGVRKGFAGNRTGNSPGRFLYPNNFGGFMTIADMLGQSGVLTVLGMGIVFLFLIILIIAVTLAGKVIHSLGWDKDVLESAKTPAPASVSGGSNHAAVTAAISAAVTEYRKDHT
jgi:oxaloacetate decarboxylase gamma subunit